MLYLCKRFQTEKIYKWSDLMLIEELIQSFKQAKSQPPQHANELLDYLQKSYIQEDISIVEYKSLYFELHKRKAEKPQSYMVHINQTHLQEINIPG